MVAVGLFLGFNQSIVGGSVAKTVACKDNSDCNDWISATQDICRNPGTISSLCVNKPRYDIRNATTCQSNIDFH